MNNKAPIDVTFEQLKSMLDVGGYDNLTEPQLYELILMIPCYVMFARDEVSKLFHEYKLAKANYQREFSRAFLSLSGSVESRKHEAGTVNSVYSAEVELIEKEVAYERIKNVPDDWLELLQALKRLCDVKYRKAGVN